MKQIVGRVAPTCVSKRIAASLTDAEWIALTDAVALAQAEWEQDDDDAVGRRRVAALERAWRKLR